MNNYCPSQDWERHVDMNTVQSLAFRDIEEMIEWFGCDHASYLGCALAGEVGELCNLIKKLERDNKFDEDKFKEELADVFIYLVLMARWFGISLEEAIIEKIEVVKERRRDNDKKQ